jgi:hypothetical protein
MQSPSKPQHVSVLSRQAVGVLLIAAGIVWAILRGLDGYSEMPIGILYTLDQPPILTALVGAWILTRSRPR